VTGEQGPGDAGNGGGRSVLGAFGLVGQLGLTVVAGGLLGGLAGYGFDAWLGTAPGFLIGGMLLGLGGGAVGACRLIVRHLKD
jgi:F0F1-type ATP synthase assembly protein I